MTRSPISQAEALLAIAAQDSPRVLQASLLAAVGPSAVELLKASSLAMLTAYAPPQSQYLYASQDSLLIARSGGTNNVDAMASQAALMIAYGTGIPSSASSNAWTFVLDGHRFYVLPLGPEGDWAYDLTTNQWCQLQSQGLPGLNFRHGVMWGLRVIGSDALYTYLYELDPNEPLDEGWRAIEHRVTGGIPTRSRDAIGVSSFILTASTDLEGAEDHTISLAYSDDNGVTWSQEYEVELTDAATQTLLWPALGSFSAPGRVFRITDFAGPIRIDGADVVLTGMNSEQE